LREIPELRRSPVRAILRDHWMDSLVLIILEVITSGIVALISLLPFVPRAIIDVANWMLKWIFAATFAELGLGSILAIAVTQWRRLFPEPVTNALPEGDAE
jgi:hypothetical protein